MIDHLSGLLLIIIVTKYKYLHHVREKYQGLYKLTGFDLQTCCFCTL